MTTFKSLLATTALLMGACSAPTAMNDTTQQAEQILAPWTSDTAPGVSVVVSLDDEIVFDRSEGLANLEHGLPLDSRHVFQVASLSKQITAFSTLLLVSDGDIDLDADIRTYLPELPETDVPITVAHLLDHMGGLREQGTLAAMAGWMAEDVLTAQQQFDLITRQRGVNFDAGTRVEYSNTGYRLLADIVARASGESFQDFTARRIFGPLEMTQTRFRQDRDALIENRASAYYPVGSAFRTVLSAEESYGSTGLYTSPVDLLKWAENFETQQVGDADVFAMMAQRTMAANGEPATFGRGHERRMYNGLETWSHGGRDAGYRSFLMRIPDADFELAIISNRTDFDTADMAYSLVDVFLRDSQDYVPETGAPWTAASDAELANYAGDYELYPGAIISLRAIEGGLTSASYGSPRADLSPLTQIGAGEFRLATYPQQSLVFSEDDGELSLQLGQHGSIDMMRLDLAPFEADGVSTTDYVGRCYSAELDANYDIRVKEDQLLVHHARLQPFPITAYQTDMFIGAGPLQHLAFERDAQGAVNGFYASAPLANDIWFDCVSGE